jgi:hypothetical protein
VGNSPSAAGSVQFAEYLVDIPFDCAPGEDKLIGNFAIGESIGNQPQDSQFTFSEYNSERG